MQKLLNHPCMSRPLWSEYKRNLVIFTQFSPQMKIYMLSLRRAAVVASHLAKIVSGMLIPTLRKT